jgi:hypothetical protein
MMKEQHQAMIKSLVSDQRAGASRDSAGQKAEPPSATPPPLPIPRGRRTLDEVIDEYLQSKRSQSA